MSGVSSTSRLLLGKTSEEVQIRARHVVIGVNYPKKHRICLRLDFLCLHFGERFLYP